MLFNSPIYPAYTNNQRIILPRQTTQQARKRYEMFSPRQNVISTADKDGYSGINKDPSSSRTDISIAHTTKASLQNGVCFRNIHLFIFLLTSVLYRYNKRNTRNSTARGIFIVDSRI